MDDIKLKFEVGKELYEKEGYKKCKICKKGYLIAKDEGSSYEGFRLDDNLKLSKYFKHYWLCSNCKRKFEVIQK